MFVKMKNMKWSLIDKATGEELMVTAEEFEAEGTCSEIIRLVNMLGDSEEVDIDDDEDEDWKTK